MRLFFKGETADSRTPGLHGLTVSTGLQWTPEHRNPTDSTDSIGLQWTPRDYNRLRKNLESVESVDSVESWSLPFPPCYFYVHDIF